jgi:hypothetical protein
MIHGGEGFAGAPREDETFVPDDAGAKGLHKISYTFDFLRRIAYPPFCVTYITYSGTKYLQTIEIPSDNRMAFLPKNHRKMSVCCPKTSIFVQI